MIDLYYWPTPNGHKITIFLEEAALNYKLIPVDITQGAQFLPEFLNISPNNKMPAIVDHDPLNHHAPLTLFESGAILLYLAEKTKKFIANDSQAHYETVQWLFWQVAGLGPMLGQNHHFVQYATENVPYAINRYLKESARLYAVLNKRLADREFIAGNYSIADMASYPWIVPHEKQKQNLDDFPHVKRWFQTMAARPAVQRAYARKEEFATSTTMSDEAKRILFGQDANSVR